MTAVATSDLRLDSDYALFSEIGRKLRSGVVMERFLTRAEIQSIRNVTVRPPEMAAAFRQIDALARLPENWDSYGGRSIQANAVESARSVLNLLSEASLDRPEAPTTPYHIAPMPNGGLQIEWRHQRKSFELWIDPAGTLSALVADGIGDLIEKHYRSSASVAADVEMIGD